MVFTIDDLCLEYLDNFRLIDEVKNEFPRFKIIAFTISNFKNKECLRESREFHKWWVNHVDWVEIAVHSYDHLYPPDGDRDDERDWIQKARYELNYFLPDDYGYRSAGWQTTNKTEGILQDLGFSYIAYQNSIKHFKTKQIESGIVNSHLYDVGSIKRIHEILQNNVT